MKKQNITALVFNLNASSSSKEFAHMIKIYEENKTMLRRKIPSVEVGAQKEMSYFLYVSVI